MISPKPVVSAIINVHNGERFIQNAIDSVLCQSYEHFELIIWDNASIDGTREIVSSVLKSDARVKFKSNPDKVPLYQARNMALMAAEGEFVAFLDSDDTWRSDKLEIAVAALSSSERDIFYSNFTIFDQDTGESDLAYAAELPSGIIRKHLSLNYTVGISTVVFRKSILHSFEGPFSSDLTIIGDFDLILRLAPEKQFAVSNLPLMTYRIHESNTSFKESKLRIREITYWKKLRIQGRSSLIDLNRAAYVSLLMDALSTSRGNLWLFFLVTLKILVVPEWPYVLWGKVHWKIKNISKSPLELRSHDADRS